jgi:hypothetical protein
MSDLVFGFSMAAVSNWATGTQLDNNSSRPCFILHPMTCSRYSFPIADPGTRPRPGNRKINQLVAMEITSPHIVPLALWHDQLH